MTDTTAIEAASFRRLTDHLHPVRRSAQKPERMIISRFCRNGLAGWYHKVIEATPDQTRAFEAVRVRFG